MIGRASCADLAELRSAFVDGSIRPADRERLSLHLLDCESCRREVADLRRVRSLLSERAPAPAEPQPPSDLSSRLMAIPAATPTSRWSPTAITSRLRRRHPVLHRRLRRAATAVAVVGVGTVLVGGVGYVAAPERVVAPVSDPTSEALAEYGGVLSQLPLAPEAVSAVAAVQPQPAGAPPGPRSVDSLQGRPLAPRELEALLEQAVGAGDQTSFRGVQSYRSTDGGAEVSASVEVVNAAGQGTELTTRDRTGTAVDTSYQTMGSPGRVADLAALALLRDSYLLSGRTGAEVAGRPAVVVEASRPAGVSASLAPVTVPVARWWLDAATGLVLWQETYDETGAVRLSTGFTDLYVGPVTLPAGHPAASKLRTTSTLTVSRAAALSDEGWACRDRLAGLSLVRLRSDAGADPGIVHMVYSDGLSTVSVVEQRGRLVDTPRASHWDSAVRAAVTDGSPRTATWQSGDTVFTVVTDPAGPLAEVVAALPHDVLPQPSTMDRVRAGWTRLGSG